MAPTTATKKASATKKTAAASSHPTFLAMIQECIKANPAEARAGVSRPTLKKFLADKYKVDMSSQSNINNLSNAIKRGSEKGFLTLPKGIGGRVKGAAKPAAGKENAPPKKAAAKKPVAKKTTAAKPAVKKAAAAKPAAKPAAKKAPAAKKPAAKKAPAAKKTATKKAPAAKSAAKPKKAPAAKKPAAKKVAAKK